MSDDHRSEKNFSGWNPSLSKEEEHGGMQPFLKQQLPKEDILKAGHADFDSPPQQKESLSETGDD
jgi:hypothetical protein